MELAALAFESCSLCQNNCEYCAHQGMRFNDPSYQMSLEELQKFIDHFQRLNCRIGHLCIHGPAEPLLWKHFNEAVRLLKNGLQIGTLSSVTNGKALHRIDEDVWEMINLGISRYDYPIDEAILEKHPGHFHFLISGGGTVVVFEHLRLECLPYQQFGGCSCPGPMFYKSMIYPHCGPPLFDACLRAKVDHLKFCVPLAQYVPNQPIAIPHFPNLPCAWCWSNLAIPKRQALHHLL